MMSRTCAALRFGVVVLAFSIPGSSHAQPEASGWTAPRTPDGHPDLQGIWANNAATPLQRPEALAGRAVLTDEELANLRTHALELFGPDADDAAFGDSVFEAALAAVDSFSSKDTETGDYNQFWLVQREWDDNRTSLIVDPPNGRFPSMTPAAQAWNDDFRRRTQRHAHWTDDRTLGERCMHEVPRLNAGYNSYFQIFQTADHVVMLQEMGHNARVFPLNLDEAPPLDDDIRQWHGDPRGRWEGETLVVKTTHYADKSIFRGSRGQQRTITERFTRVEPDKLRYEVTVDDPETWTQPWTVVIFMSRSEDALYEYACHEGNIGMEGILAGARALEKAEAEGRR